MRKPRILSGEKYVVLVIYDIVKNKRRNKMVKVLESYSIRVQKSAFEAYIDKKMYKKMVSEIKYIIDPETDSLRIYFLNFDTEVKTFGIAHKHQEDIVIV